MPTNTYTPIASVTLSATASEVVFSGLPQTFRDLIVVVEAAHSSSAADYDLHMQFNGDTTSTYSYVAMYGLGSGSGASFSGTAGFAPIGIVANSTRAYNSPNVIQIQDYSQTNKHKSVISRWNSSAYIVGSSAARWANNSAISSIRFFINTNPNFTSGSTFTVFGVIA